MKKSSISPLASNKVKIIQMELFIQKLINGISRSTNQSSSFIVRLKILVNFSRILILVILYTVGSRATNNRPIVNTLVWNIDIATVTVDIDNKTKHN